MPYKPVTHVIFDMDGLMLDTEERYFLLTQEILQKYDKNFTWEAKKQIMGMNLEQMAQKMVELFELPISPKEYLGLHEENALNSMKDAQLMPGAERLLRHLTSNKVLCALGTASPQNLIELKSTNHSEVFKLFNHIVSGSSDPDVKNGKPAPDIFLIAAQRFPDKPDMDKCLVLEDAPNGVLAAYNAGMQVVMVPDRRVSDEDRKFATLVLDSLLDFKPEEFGLPPFPDNATPAAGKPSEGAKPAAPTAPASAIKACDKDIRCCCAEKE